MITFSVTSTFPQMRVESVLRDTFPEFSRAKWRAQVDKGSVLVNGKKVRAGHILKLHDFIEAEEPREFFPGNQRISTSEIKLEVIFEDQYLICVKKPRGMHTVLQREGDPVTLADLVVAYDKDCLFSSPNPLDGGLVQRLDYFTSGVCIAAKSREIWTSLHDLLVDKKVRKTYIARVSDTITKGDIEISEIFESAQILNTITGQHSDVRVSLRDGSRHIVRREFRKLDFPLIGDKDYGSEDSSQQNKGSSDYLLHAEEIEFRHPKSKQEMKLVCEL